MATSALPHPESRCQDRYLTDQVAIYRRYAELVRREMEIKQSQVKKRYYQVFVKPNVRRRSHAGEREAAPTSQPLRAATGTHPGVISSDRLAVAAPRSQPPILRKRGTVRATLPVMASSPAPIATSRKFPRAPSQSVSAAAAAIDPLSSRVSALSLYAITANSLARSRMRTTRSTSRRGRGCSIGCHIDCSDDNSDGGGSVASASDFPTLVNCIRRRLTREARQQRRLAARNTALRRAQSAALEQNPLFAEEQCWRKGADGVIRRRTVTNPQPSQYEAAAAVEESPDATRMIAFGVNRNGRLGVTRGGDNGSGGITFLTELPSLPTAAVAAAAAATATADRQRPPQKLRRERCVTRAPNEQLRPLIGSLS